jgi:hypothetical protein
MSEAERRIRATDQRVSEHVRKFLRLIKAQRFSESQRIPVEAK